MITDKAHNNALLLDKFSAERGEIRTLSEYLGFLLKN